jgi:hypothetical protein
MKLKFKFGDKVWHPVFNNVLIVAVDKADSSEPYLVINDDYVDCDHMEWVGQDSLKRGWRRP